MDVSALFPPRDEPDAAQEAAIAAACARLGCAQEWIAEDGYEHSIVGGAIDGERVAWVERRWRQEGGREDVEYHLRLRAGEVPLREWVVDTYNPYFGCDVGYLRWCGDEVVAIYSEKHHTIACILGAAGPPRMRAIDYYWQVVGDEVLFASDARGLVERLRLPDLSWRAPLSGADALHAMREGTCPEGQSMIEPPAALQRAIAARLPAMSQALADLLIGALAFRFWDPWPPLVATYEEAFSPRRWNPPCWLPFYRHAASAGAEARALLERLDAVAARPPAEAGPDEIAAELACRHIASRCRELAAACRAGKLPEETSCYFWADWSQASFAASESLFPPGMWAAWQALRPRARELHALGKNER